MLLDEDESSDQRVAILAAISKTQAVIARKRAAVALDSGVEVDAEGGDTSHHSQPSHRHHQPRTHSAGYVSVREHRSEFFDLWSQKVEAFLSDPGKTALELPSELSANDRRELHQLAEKFNLSHMSEGTGADRHLVLRKDQLHYKAPEYRPTPTDLNALKNTAAAHEGRRGHHPQPSSTGQQQQQQRTSIESRFALRRVRTSDDEPKYADADAERALRRLDKATDHYRHAVEVGMTMEELLRGEHKSLEDTLAEEDPAAPKQLVIASAQKQQQQRPAVTASENRAWAGVLAKTAASSSSATTLEGAVASPREQNQQTVFDEQCLSCGTRVRVDYEVDSWTCCGQCPVCRKETIWRLVEVLADAPREEIDKDNEHGSDTASNASGEEEEYQVASAAVDKSRARKKRARQDDDDDRGHNREPIDKESDADVDGDGVAESLGCATLDEAVELATVNDVPTEDVDFLRWFAACLARGNVPLSSKLLFVIDFNELCEVVPFAPPRPGSAASRVSRPLFVQVTAVEGVAGDRKPIHATKLLREVLDCIGSAEEGSDGEQIVRDARVTVAFPSTSLYGSVLSVVARVEGPRRAQDRWWASTGLPNLERKYGVKHLRVEGDIRDLLRD